MKIKLGGQYIQINRIKKVTKAGGHIAQLHMKNGASLHVICGIRIPDHRRFAYDSTVEELQALIERLKG